MKEVRLTQPVPLQRVSSVLEDALGRFPGDTVFPFGGTSRILEGERRRAAVLFLDLTGFTILSESIDHEDLHVIIGRLMTLLSRVVTSHGGYVDKFEGDRLMALFGAVDSTENDCSRAVACALRMIDLLEELRTAMRDFPDLSARIGIDFGPLTVAPDPSGHLTATGLTVNLASRLEESAPVGTVLVSGNVRQESGDLYEWEDLGSLEVRSIRTPVPVHRPVGPGALRMERWQRAERLKGAPFVGRKALMKALTGELARGASAPVFLLTGEAGIGKSRLAHECLETMESCRVLRGHALSRAQPACWLWISLFRDYFHAGTRGDTSGDWFEERVLNLAEGCGRERLRAVLEYNAAPFSALLCLDTEGFQSALSSPDAVTDLLLSALEAVFSTQPALLLLEDLHWADELSLKVLRSLLGQELSAGPAGIVLTSRHPAPNLDSTAMPLHIHELKPLNQADCLEIASHLLLGEPMHPDLAEVILDAGRGNPFFVEELVLTLLESGGVFRSDDGIWELAASRDRLVIPSSISILTQSRMDRLPARERLILQFASVLGERFELPFLEEVTRRVNNRDEPLHPILVNLTDRGFLTLGRDGGFRFRHAMVRSAAYETLLRHNARLIHRTAAEILEHSHTSELQAMAPLLLSHWEAAEVIPRALHWAVRAMIDAGKGGRPEEAMALTDKVLGWTRDTREQDAWNGRMHALHVRFDINERSGRHEEAIRIGTGMLEDSRKKGNRYWEITALREISRVHQELGRLAEAREGLEKALSAAELQGDPVLLAKTKMVYANYLCCTGRRDGVMELYLEAARTLENAGLSAEAASLYTNMAVHAFRWGDDTVSRGYAEKAARIQKKRKDLNGLGYSLNSLGIVHAREGNPGTAGEVFLEALDACRRSGNTIHESTILGNLGLLAKRQGRIAEAVSYVEASIDLATRTRNYRTVAISLVNLADLQRLSGRLDQALASARKSLEVNAVTGEVLNTGYAMAMEGLILMDMGREEEAFRISGELRDHVDRHRIREGLLEDYRKLMDALRERGFEPASPEGWSPL